MLSAEQFREMVRDGKSSKEILAACEEYARETQSPMPAWIFDLIDQEPATREDAGELEADGVAV